MEFAHASSSAADTFSGSRYLSAGEEEHRVRPHRKARASYSAAQQALSDFIVFCEDHREPSALEVTDDFFARGSSAIINFSNLHPASPAPDVRVPIQPISTAGRTVH